MDAAACGEMCVCIAESERFDPPGVDGVDVLAFCWNGVEAFLYQMSSLSVVVDDIDNLYNFVAIIIFGFIDFFLTRQKASKRASKNHQRKPFFFVVFVFSFYSSY